MIRQHTQPVRRVTASYGDKARVRQPGTSDVATGQRTLVTLVIRSAIDLVTANHSPVENERLQDVRLDAGELVE